MSASGAPAIIGNSTGTPSSVIKIRSESARITVNANPPSQSSSRAGRRSGSPSPAAKSARQRPQARTASTPEFGLKVKASPQASPATKSAPFPPRTTWRSIAACAPSQNSAAYHAGYGMLNDANSPTKKGRKAA
jgi:hypothetical protein